MPTNILMPTLSPTMENGKLADAHGNWADLRNHVLPRLVNFDPDAGDALAEPLDGSYEDVDRELVSYPFLGRLQIIHRVGEKDVAELVNFDMVESWGVSTTVVAEAAIVNLRRHYSSHARRQLIEGIAYGLDLPLEMASSMLLDGTYWFDDEVPIEHVIVAIPYRDALMFADSRNPAARELIATISNDMWDACIPRHRLSRRLLVSDNAGGWRAADSSVNFPKRAK
jgi:hypothetical protein